MKQPTEYPGANPRGNGASPGETEVPAPASTAVKIAEPSYIDVSAFIVKQTFDSALGIESVTTHVSVRRPKKEEWIRAHPTSAIPVFILKGDAEAGGDGEVYVLTGEVAREVAELARPARLVLTENRAGVRFFWPVAIPDANRPNAWHLSALKAVELARQRWVRVVASQADGCYTVKITQAEIPDPSFAGDVDELLKLALERRGIASANHDYIQRLLTGK
jgi:hypothetical protein